VKHKGATEYRNQIINTIAPFWKYGSCGDFHECVANVVAARHHKRAMKENTVKRLKGEANKWDTNLVPNDYWVTMLLPFIYPHVTRGKNNVTLNRGPNASWNFDQHESRNKNKKLNEDAAKTAEAAKKKKDTKSVSRRKRRTRSSPLTVLARRRKL
jgi:hypothetical protein